MLCYVTGHILNLGQPSGAIVAIVRFITVLMDFISPSWGLAGTFKALPSFAH